MAALLRRALPGGGGKQHLLSAAQGQHLRQVERPDAGRLCLRTEDESLPHASKRLKDPEDPVDLFFEATTKLGAKIGPVLLQLPPNLKADLPLLKEAIEAFPKNTRITIEFRHEAWYTKDIKSRLADCGIALWLADRGSKDVTPIWRTADWSYLRLHEGHGTPHPCYSENDLEEWAKRITELWKKDENVGNYPFTVGSRQDYNGGWETRYTAKGTPYSVWRWPMPRISDNYLDCVFYLYSTKSDADKGKRVGGSGFIVRVDAKTLGQAHHLYAVTNWHVIRDGAPVIRINTTDDAFEVLELNASDWIRHKAGDDVAVCPIGLSSEHYRYRSIPTSLFLNDNLLLMYNIGIGDDVFVVGRFVNHEGRQRNLPSVRFGNIGMMPWEPIKKNDGFLQECFLVELRSVGGYSGSPVFVWRPVEGMNFGVTDINYTPAYTGPWLLGIDSGHLPDYRYVLDNNNRATNSKVEIGSGMALVVPAWKLLELLESENFMSQRQQKEEEEQKRLEQEPPAVDDSIITPNDFEDALRKVSRRIKPSEPDEASTET